MVGSGISHTGNKAAAGSRGSGRTETRILTVTEQQGLGHYPTTLFAASEVLSGNCTSRGIIYTACIAAGLMTHQFTRWLRGVPVDLDLSLNLLASELTVTDNSRPTTD